MAGSTTIDSGKVTDGLLNGCTADDFNANDETALTGDAGASARTMSFLTRMPLQYSPHCMKIKVGQSVTWMTTDGHGHGFASHPLTPFGGDPNNPILDLDAGGFDDGDVGTFTFPTAGMFGFRCDMHTEDMYGAILVVP